MIEILLSSITAAFSILGASLIRKIEKRRLLELETERKKIISELDRAQKEMIPDQWEILYSIPEYSISTIATKEEMKESAVETIRSLDKRLRNIELRFPADSTLDKISSVNDAILATNLESLTARIEKLEENMLTKWDVATVMFEIIGFFAVIITIIVLFI